MAAKAIREYAGKKLLAQYFTDHPIPVPGTSGRNHLPNSRLLHVSPASFPALDNAPNDHLWLQAPDVKLVAKPDQLIKRRGQAGALALNKSWDEIKEWIREHMHKEVTVCTCSFLCPCCAPPRPFLVSEEGGAGACEIFSVPLSPLPQ
eukprot:TRINITY_DN5750_c0_g1_i2.p3 TRINITY_DN5750_c0_g1~~TRINITY_DN5750_c0_g1_i2.p3  ORF type:complete len:148 (+),score=18.69 TRINITY_DN5750_c0_g1_i2:269-712(+)